MTSYRKAFWWSFAALAFCALAVIWFLINFDRRAEEVRGFPKREAIRNPYLAAERLLRGLGYHVDAVQEAAWLQRLPPRGVLILTGRREYHLTPARTKALLDWVRSGGYVVAEAGLVGQGDPLLREFDVRLKPRKSARTERADVAANDEDDGTAAPVKRQARPAEPARRIVAIPGYGRELRMRANAGRPLYVGDVAPSWGVKGTQDKEDEQRMELLEFRLGEGAVTLINGLWRFGNYTIESEDHAELLAALIAAHPGSGQLVIMTRLGVPSLWEWLNEHAQAAVASGLLLLAAWLWHIMPRFGVVRAEPPAERRSLIEHLRAIGRFLWRKQALGVLLAAARANLGAQIAVRHAVADESAAHGVALLARRTGVHERAIQFALYGTPESPAQFTEALRTLQELETQLR